MKIKIIDLFIKLANKEEVPPKLVYKFKNGNFYEEYYLNWDNERNTYFYISNNDFKAHSIVDLLAANLWNLSDEVEIIEERPKEIEEWGKIPLKELEEKELERQELQMYLKTVIDTQNELIRGHNYLLKKENSK